MRKRYTINDIRYTNTYAVILAGGKGKRLRPLSTDSRPKPFLSVTRDRETLLSKTVKRIRGIVSPKNIIVVANMRQSKLVKATLPGLARNNIFLEPVSRNTAPAIWFAASLLRRRCPEAVMVVLPADHYVIGDKAYLSAIRKGIDFVRNIPEAIVMMGIEPKFPATEYGYMRVKSQEPIANGVYKVERFTEKPDLRTARRFLRSRKYLWNAGAFIFTAKTILKCMEKFAPFIYTPLRSSRPVSRTYKKLPSMSIDYAVLEKADNNYCVKGRYGWCDVGSFKVLKDILRRESRNYVIKGGRIISIP